MSQLTVWQHWCWFVFPHKNWQLNLSSCWLILWQSLALALVNRKISYAKNKCDIRSWPLNPIRWMSLSQIAFSNRMERRSKQRIERYGDKGSPWRTPLLWITSGRGAPFHFIWKQVDDIIFMISVMRFGRTWENSSDSLIKGHSKWS